ncbi:MAG: methylmalonyl-CoA decarboxylase [Elusimicrobiaceae bacterium]
MSYITLQRSGKTGVITFSNPRRRNALCAQLCDEIAQALAELASEKMTTVILRAEKNAVIWSAGHDVNELPVNDKDPLAYDAPMEKMFHAIERYPGVVIAMIQGSVWGGACDMAMTCDIIVADKTATFAITPVKIGLPYNPSGILHFRNRVGLGFAKEMFFTAKPIPAERAYQTGIINHCVEADEIESYTMEMADGINQNSALAIAVIKEQMRILFRATPISPDTFEHIEQLRRKVYTSRDYKEGIKSFLEKRKPDFKGE